MPIVVVLVAAGAEAQIVIDPFDAEQTQMGIGGNVAHDASILGGARALLIYWVLSPPWYGTGGSLQVTSGALKWSPAYASTLVVGWPGPSGNFTGAGLGGIDLTAGGAYDRFRIDVNPDEFSTALRSLTLDVMSGDYARSRAFLQLKGAEYVDVPFSAFVRYDASTAADLTAIRSIALRAATTMTSLDWIIVTNGLPTIELDDANWIESEATSGRVLHARESDGFATVDVERVGPLTGISTVQYATIEDTAVGGVGYVPTSGTLTFAPNEARKSFKIPLLRDSVYEPFRWIGVKLSAANGGTLGPASTARIYLTDEESIPSISVADVSQAEGNGGLTTFTFTAHLSNPSATETTFHYTTADGTATAPVDYKAVAPEKTVTFPPMVTSAVFTVDVVGDANAELDEKFDVNVVGPSGSAHATATIFDDDGAANLSLGMTAATTMFMPGDDTTYILTVANAGPDAATNVVVTDALPSGVTFVSATPSAGTCTGIPTVVCTIPTLVSGAAATITLIVQIGVRNPVSNTASVTARQADSVMANNAAAITLQPADIDPVPIDARWMLALLTAAIAVAATRLLRR